MIVNCRWKEGQEMERERLSEQAERDLTTLPV